MDAKRNDGGPAFAALATTAMGDVHHQEGMSLRDWFAGQALVAFIAADGAQFFERVNDHAEDAYAQADAMLKARSS